MAINKKKEGTATLNSNVAKQFTTNLKGWGNQNFFCPFTDSKFTLETVTVEQVERMIRRGSKSFAKIEDKATAPAVVETDKPKGK